MYDNQTEADTRLLQPDGVSMFLGNRLAGTLHLNLENSAEEEWEGQQACIRPCVMMTMLNP